MGQLREFEWLQHYRHDIMNELQVVQGYLHMNKPGVAKQKLDDWIHALHEEQKLFHTNARQFIKWIFMIKYRYEQFQLTYKIESKSKLTNIDSLMMDDYDKVVKTVIAHQSENELYDLHIVISEQPEKMICHLNITGYFSCKHEVVKELEKLAKNNEFDIQTSHDEDNILCIWTYKM